jgi:predicted nucleic acid-binding protein
MEAAVCSTPVVIDHDLVDPALLPDESATSAVTLAELAAGPHATTDHQERARRQDRLPWAAATWDPLPFDAEPHGRTAGCSPRPTPQDARAAPARPTS